VSLRIDPGSLPREDCDFLILGAGVAGGQAALELAGHGRLMVVAKERGHPASTAAQGGIAAAFSAEDSIRQHAMDTITCGRGLVDEDVALLTAEEGKERVKELLDMGCAFDRRADGELHLTREGGHSRARVLHARGDRTGQEIVRVLAKQLGEAGVGLIRAEMAVDLVMEGGRCTGAVVLFSGEKGFRYVRACRATILCTGGLGAIFSRNTNPPSATGDGLAMAFRAGAEVADLEFVQFHPTVHYVSGESGFLISEAVRGEGAVLRNSKGRAFMPDYSAEADLAPRDVTARAIWREEKLGRGPVTLDIENIEVPFAERFPGIMAWPIISRLDDLTFSRSDVGRRARRTALRLALLAQGLSTRSRKKAPSKVEGLVDFSVRNGDLLQEFNGFIEDRSRSHNHRRHGIIHQAHRNIGLFPQSLGHASEKRAPSN